MKKTTLLIGLALFSFCLISQQTTTQADVNNLIHTPILNSLNGPPEVLFNISKLFTDNILQVVVFETNYFLDNATVELNGVAQNGTWSNTTTPPFSLSEIAPPDSREYEVNIPKTDFTEGDHNTIDVIAGNTGNYIMTCGIVLCDTPECWGPGPLPLSVKESQVNLPADTLDDEDTTPPEINFDLTSLSKCGHVTPIITDTESGIEFSNITFEDSLLIVYAVNGEGLFSQVGIIFQGIEIECIGCVDFCDSCTDEGSTFILPSIIALSVLMVCIIRRRKTT